MSLPRKFLAGRNGVVSWWLVIVCLAAVRLHLSAGDEIYARNDDSRNYARATLHYLKGTSDDSIPPQRPGLPMLARFVTGLGTPWKVFLDWMLAGTVVWAAWLLRVWTHSGLTGLLGGGLMLFSPWFISNSINFTTEPLCAILLVVFALSVTPWIRHSPRRWKARWTLFPSFMAGILVLVRPELTVVLASWTACLLGIVAANGKAFFCRGPRKSRILHTACLLAPLLIPFAITKCLETVHARHYGIQAMSGSEAPGLMNLMNALYSIKPEQDIRFAPVTLQSLEAACNASPTLNEHRDSLLDRNGTFVITGSERLGLNGEPGTWLNWHIEAAFSGLSQQSDRRMALAAEEIRQALESGRLPARSARFPIDPLVSSWLSEIPQQFLNSLRWAMFPLTSVRNTKLLTLNERQMSLVETGLYDDAALRRKGVTGTALLRLQGTFFGTVGRHSSVRIVDSRQQVLNEIKIDISGQRHRFECLVDTAGLNSKDGLHIEFSGDEEQASQRFSLPLTSGTQALFVNGINPGESPPGYWEVTTTLSGERFKYGDKWGRWCARRFPTALWIAMALVTALGLRWRPSRRQLRRAWLLALVVLTILLVRSAFFTLIEVWLGWGLQRYVAPHQPLLVWWTMLSVFLAGTTCRYVVSRRLKRRRTN